MKFSFWPHGHRPTFAELLFALAKLACLGALVGFVSRIVGLYAGEGSHWYLAGVEAKNLWVSAACGAIFTVDFYLCCALPWVYLGPAMTKFPKSIRMPVSALVGAVGSCLGLTVSLFLSGKLPGVHNAWANDLGYVLWGEAVAGAVIALVIGAFRKLQHAVEEAEAKVHERELRGSQLAEAAAKAQSAALQSQINPHFFFNTLNTLSALIPAGSKDAQEIVGRLADMFRYTLACSRAESVTLDQELEFTENYLRLEQARFRERLHVTLPRGNFADIFMPGLSLQPLVENAIKYGVAKRLEGGTVEVAVRRNGSTCAVDVVSPADGFADQARYFRAGHALENVRDRLKLFAGENADVDVAELDPDRVRVSLVLPR